MNLVANALNSSINCIEQHTYRIEASGVSCENIDSKAKVQGTQIENMYIYGGTASNLLYIYGKALNFIEL